MPAPAITVRTCNNVRVAGVIASAIVREYDNLAVTTVATEGEHPQYNVCVERRDGFRIANDWVQALIAFASGAAAAAAGFFADHPQPASHDSGCEFCRPTTGDPFTNRPRGEAWTCPYCGKAFAGKETS